MILTIDLVPTTCWYSNVRSNVSPETWDSLQRQVFTAADFRCEICTRRGPAHPVECHEEWHYDDHRLIQRLGRLVSLCPNCHEVKHFGLALSRGKSGKTLEWLSRVNQISPSDALAHVQRAFQIHAIRSRFSWTLDVSVLTTQYGVQLDPGGIELGLSARNAKART